PCFECSSIASSIGDSAPASKMDDSIRAIGFWATLRRFEKEPNRPMDSPRAALRLKEEVLISLLMSSIEIRRGARAQRSSTNRQRQDTGTDREIFPGARCALDEELERAICQLMTFLAENEYSALYVPAKWIAR